MNAILERNTKVKLKPDVQERRNKFGLTTPYIFDTEPVYNIEDYEGTHPCLEDKNQLEHCYRLSGGMIKPVDRDNVEFGISQIIIPGSALIPQE